MTAFIILFVILGYGAVGAIFGLILTYLLSSVLIFFFLRKTITKELHSYFLVTRKLFSFSKNLFGANAINLIQNQTDTLMIAYFLTATEVGYYSIAISLLRFFPLIPLAIQKVTYPTTSFLFSEKNYGKINLLFDRSQKYSTYILTPLALIVIFFGRDLIDLLFGSQFRFALLPLYILLFARLIRGCLDVPLGGSLSAAGKPVLVMKFTLFSAILNIILNIILIPKYGIVGAALATSLSLILGSVLNLIFTIKIFKFKMDYKWFLKLFGIFIGSIFSFFTLTKLLNYNFIIGLPLVILFVLLLFLFFIEPHDKILIFKALKRLKR